MNGGVRNPNTFEKILLFIGVFVIIFGYALIHSTVVNYGFGWSFVIAVFLWLILICFVILLAVTENVKEELKEVIHYQLKETQLIKEELKVQQHTMSRKL